MAADINIQSIGPIRPPEDRRPIEKGKTPVLESSPDSYSPATAPLPWSTSKAQLTGPFGFASRADNTVARSVADLTKACVSAKTDGVQGERRVALFNIIDKAARR